MTTPETVPPPTWRTWAALPVLALPLFMMATDFTAMFLALPAVTADLAPTTSQMLWIVHVGELVAAGTLITMGWLVGRLGPRALLLIAMALYGSASALAAVAPDVETLVLARVLLGVATAAASPAAIAMLRSLFTGPRHYGIAFAVVMGAFSVGGALGPPMAGLLLDHFWWGSVFLVNVPVAAVVLPAGWWLLPRSGRTGTDRIDVTSVVVSVAAVMLTVYGLQELAGRGLSAQHVLTALAGGLLAIWFVRRQHRVANPLLDLGLFSRRVVWVITVVFLLSQVAFMAVDLVLTQYLQIVAGIPPGTLGLLMTLPAITSIAATAATPLLTRRFTPAIVMGAGLGLAVIGALAVAAAVAVAPEPAVVVAGMMVVALGVSPPMVLGAQLMVTSVPRARAGQAAAVQDISASLGAAAGIMVLGGVATAVFGREVRAEAPFAVSGTLLDAATESPGGALAVAEGIGGAVGADLVPVVERAWSSGTMAAYATALVVGVVTVLVAVRGLRGIVLPDDTDTDSGRGSEVEVGPGAAVRSGRSVTSCPPGPP